MSWASQERSASAKRNTGKGKLLPRDYGLPLICPSSRRNPEGGRSERNRMEKRDSCCSAVRKNGEKPSFAFRSVSQLALIAFARS